ncbi:TPM domain-containing protein [Sphingomonas montana]|uniref:TPM domain-containing protein n=1 Tax=Sphingomonas montana TaxID=1843236 RepID=UPI00096DD825|nr:TPM domain-containing protein [Sphingomonas montana]
MRNLHRASMTAVAALLTCGCGQADDASRTASSAARVEAIASTLQACSYDGKTLQADGSALTGGAPRDCASAVTRIMGYTGLPANFVVVSGPVPNAAAVILLDDKRVPRRVIAFNPEFMQAAEAQVGGSVWGPISIMAHEIAHHLSGHTIVPGGSRPEIELEADKFSGYVLQKMGAPLADAQRMILTVGSNHGSPTHPAKDRRAASIRQGWAEARAQSGGLDCRSGNALAASTRIASGSTGAAVTPAGPTPPSAVTPPVANASVPARTLPTPGSIPFKYGRFIVDETGRLDPARVRTMEQRLYGLAKNAGVEMSILVVNDLKGLSANDYAWAMMRQLRVGKLDVGNGAVAVVAPRQRQAAVAFGPGLAKEAEFSDPNKQLLQWIDAAWPNCEDADGCAGWTDTLFSPFNGTLFWAERSTWTIEYRSLSALLDHYDAVDAERRRTKRSLNPQTDLPNGKLVRVAGRITSLRSPTGFGQANARLLSGKLGYTAVSMTTDDGHDLVLYVAPRLAPLMPSGALKNGARYTAVGRLHSTGDKASKQASTMWLFSYDEI